MLFYPLNHELDAAQERNGHKAPYRPSRIRILWTVFIQHRTKPQSISQVLLSAAERPDWGSGLRVQTSLMSPYERAEELGKMSLAAAASTLEHMLPDTAKETVLHLQGSHQARQGVATCVQESM